MSDKFRVLIADSMSSRASEILSACDATEVDDRAGISVDELKAAIGDYDGLLVRSRTKVTADIIEHARKLKVIGRAGIGVDNIDLAAATARGIHVENAPHGNLVTTAEHAICLLLSLARNIPQATASMKAGKWEKKKLGGSELRDKNFGVIGLGNIGKIVAELGAGLKMHVIAHDPFVTDEVAKELGIELVSLDELLARADFITIHTPLNDKTRGLIGSTEFGKMKKGVMLVHAARGGIVDELALVTALEEGIVAGAAIDVFVEEPVAADSKLVAHPHVICTPHLGASTAEAQIKVAVAVADQMAAFAERGEVINTVNKVA
jgi:D-3-phosphoglycerate dehydrogenase